ncbi:MAG: asparagine synthase (glutamine-hydrolyzing), partial [Chloroflexia bacterium]|nr:asparagine synthase (glutamine-hydrolyzing) [Chloroflexia bacterium]
EVILAAYQEWGTNCLEHFNGMWAFALWDGRKRHLFLSRDRFGIKPLYYTWDGCTLRFASEIKALVGACGIPFEPDDHAVYRYLVAGLLPSPTAGTTFFTGVAALPPGHQMLVTPGQHLVQRYWQLPPNDHNVLAADEAVVAYRELFEDALRLQLRSDVAIGTCLSGGVDSSSIVCMLQRMLQAKGMAAANLGDRQKTFSAVYTSDGPYNERAYIEHIIAATGVEKNLTVPTVEQLGQDVEALIWHQDEPFPSTSIFAQWCVMRAVRERGVTVLLDGQGADESLGGYRPFEVYLGEQLRHGQLATALVNLLALQARAGVEPLGLTMRALALQLPEAIARPLLRRYGPKQADFSVLQPDFVRRHGHRSAADWWDLSQFTTLQAHLRSEIEERNLPHLLRYEDRNSMAFSVEARVPFLDHRLVELSFTKVAPWRIAQGWTKWVLRQAMEGIVPDRVIWRSSKIGFATPEEEWMATWMQRYPETFADGAHSHPYLNLAAVRQALAQGVATKEDTWRLWRWINLEQWLQIWQAA